MFATFCIPKQEKDSENTNKNCENSKEPYAAHRSTVASTPMLIDLSSTFVAKRGKASTYNIKEQTEKNQIPSFKSLFYPFLHLFSN